MNTPLIIVLIISLVLNATLVVFILSFRRDAKQFRANMAALSQRGAQRKHFGHGGKSLDEINAELNALMDDFQNIIETQRERPNKQLTESISRDIRAPLASLTGYLEALREKGSAGNGRGEYLEIVYRKARLMDRTIGEFFELAALEAGGETPELTPVNLKEVIRGTLAAFDQEFASAAVTPVVELPSENVTALGDRAAVERVLSNLLFNALKNGSCGGTITVTLGADDASAYISVADCGRGIAQADLPHVFDGLYTAETARSAMERGTGLGLAIARQLAVRQNGDIAVRSVPGDQTVFTLTLHKA